ncbi:MAG TPA: 3-hydroxyacyl-CoA dehydrogenase family protein [Flavisolibacter sp.]|nr:3-hydroxyacyl-CoA dehydrogenase family protein [Flavisolibacter sp.]
MQIVVVADGLLKDELLSNGIQDNVEISWVKDVNDLVSHKNADAFIDLSFNGEPDRVELLQQFLPKPVILNSVTHTLQELGYPFVRINAWPGFLKGQSIEASVLNEEAAKKAAAVLNALNKKLKWVKDEPGFISARVLLMIINEAFLAWQEGVSSKEEIDIAMKMGTNYPYGPFEWAQMIGLGNLANLFEKLKPLYPRYQPASSILSSAGKE